MKMKTIAKLCFSEIFGKYAKDEWLYVRTIPPIFGMPPMVEFYNIRALIGTRIHEPKLKRVNVSSFANNMRDGSIKDALCELSKHGYHIRFVSYEQNKNF